MALQISYNAEQFGISFDRAYAKIIMFEGNINEVTFYISLFASQEARLANKNAISSFQFSMPYQDGMTYASVYNYLKTLPEFIGAQDV
jgi:hypothetical protein